MEFLQHFLAWQPVEENRQDSLGLRATLNTDAGALRWVNGVDTEYTDGSPQGNQQEDFSPNHPAGVHYDYQVGATVAAAYSQLRTKRLSPGSSRAGCAWSTPTTIITTRPVTAPPARGPPAAAASTARRTARTILPTGR